MAIEVVGSSGVVGFNIRFTPITIQETGDPSCIQIEQIVKIFFDNIEALEHYHPQCMYILEHEIDGVPTEDFDPQTIFPNLSGVGERRMLGHSPLGSLKRLKKDFLGITSLQDRVSVLLDKRKPALNGDLTWNIPTFIYNAKDYLDRITTDPKEYPDLLDKEDISVLLQKIGACKTFSLNG